MGWLDTEREKDRKRGQRERVGLNRSNSPDGGMRDTSPFGKREYALYSRLRLVIGGGYIKVQPWNIPSGEMKGPGEGRLLTMAADGGGTDRVGRIVCVYTNTHTHIDTNETRHRVLKCTAKNVATSQLWHGGTGVNS